MKIKTDLHIHTVLSACCSQDNSVLNVVNMAKLLDKKIIAFADHNSCLNCAAGMAAASKEGILFVPAMEVTTAEEIHVLCLFKDIKSAFLLQSEVASHLPKYTLNEKIYCPQRVLDEEDKEIERIPYLLNVASSYDIYSLVQKVKELGGIAIPAHIDRESNSVLAVLGELPPDLEVSAVELSKNASNDLIEEYAKKYRVIQSSDAHCLEDMCLCDFELDLKELSVQALFDCLEGK